MKRIVRIRKVDLPGERKVRIALCKIKGVDFMMSNAILNVLNIDGDSLIGELPDTDIDRLKGVIENPTTLDIPKWLLNRRKDAGTGEDKHLTGMDIPLAVREDIKGLQETKARRGFRHGAKLKVRGQRTKAHPRRGKTVGVITKKKAAKMQKKPEGKKETSKKPAAKGKAKPAAKGGKK